MYRLLIVDDEPNIVDWLYELFRGISHIDLDIYKAYSGTGALKWLNQIKIDIVISDIRMPGMNGLQLLERIRDNWPLCKIIFLTGYNEFDYVYAAIQHQGVSYLLKTEEDDEIVKAVEKSVEQIEKNLKIDELENKARQQIKMALPLLQKEYISWWLSGEKKSKEISQHQLDELEIPLKVDSPIILMLGRTDNLPNGVSLIKKREYIYGIKFIANQYLSARTTCFCTELENQSVLFVIQSKEVKQDGVGMEGHGSNQLTSFSWEQTVLYVRDTLETIQASCKQSLSITVSFVFNNEPFLFDQAPLKYTSLRLLLDYRIGIGIEMILTDKNMNDLDINITINHNAAVQHSHAQLNKLGALGTYLERGQPDEFFLLFSELTECLNELTSMNYNLALEIYYAISLMYLSYINRWNLTEKLAFRIGLGKLVRIDEHGTWKDAVLYLEQLAHAIFDFQANEQEKRATDAISRVQQYINEHLNEDISLVKLAEQVYLNPSYLSRLFKQVTGGINLSDYIFDMRVKKAKDMLKMDGIKIHEVASAVGYESSTYFAKFFKKVTNMTPQDYRNSILNR